MYPRYSLAIGALALVATFPTVAADKESETIVVTATRFNEPDPKIAANISVISRQDILNTPAQSLPEVLSTRAGIDVRQLGGAMGRDSTIDTVSYTHLDVYKRQLQPRAVTSVHFFQGRVPVPLQGRRPAYVARRPGLVQRGSRACLLYTSRCV